MSSESLEFDHGYICKEHCYISCFCTLVSWLLIPNIVARHLQFRHTYKDPCQLLAQPWILGLSWLGFL